MIQYRLTKWGLDKKIKEVEMAAAARLLTQRQAAGKRTAITIRGRNVDLQGVHRFTKRRNMSLEQLISMAPAETPSAVRCHTPDPVRMVPAEQLVSAAPAETSPAVRCHTPDPVRMVPAEQLVSAAPAEILSSAHSHTPGPVYMRPTDIGSLEQRFLIHSQNLFESMRPPNIFPVYSVIRGTTRQTTRMPPVSESGSTRLAKLLQSSIPYFQSGHIALARQQIDSAMAMVPLALEESGTYMLSLTMEQVRQICQTGCHQFAFLVVQHLMEWTAGRNPSEWGCRQQMMRIWLEVMHQSNCEQFMMTAEGYFVRSIAQRLYKVHTKHVGASKSLREIFKTQKISGLWKLPGALRPKNEAVQDMLRQDNWHLATEPFLGVFVWERGARPDYPVVP